METFLKEICINYENKKNKKTKKISKISNEEPNIFDMDIVQNLFLECDNNISFIGKIKSAIISPYKFLTKEEITEKFTISNISTCLDVFNIFITNVVSNDIQYLYNHYLACIELTYSKFIVDNGLSFNINVVFEEKKIDEILDKLSKKNFNINFNANNKFISTIYVNHKKNLIDLDCLLKEKEEEIKLLKKQLEK